MQWLRLLPRSGRPAAQLPPGGNLQKVLGCRSRDAAESSYADLTVRRRRARQSRAGTAYTYFSSKNHLIAEVYLDMVRQVPISTDVNQPTVSRVEQGRYAASPWSSPTNPGVAAACTTALLSG